MKTLSNESTISADKAEWPDKIKIIIRRPTLPYTLFFFTNSPCLGNFDCIMNFDWFVFVGEIISYISSFSESFQTTTPLVFFVC